MYHVYVMYLSLLFVFDAYTVGVDPLPHRCGLSYLDTQHLQSEKNQLQVHLCHGELVCYEGMPMMCTCSITLTLVTAVHLISVQLFVC